MASLQRRAQVGRGSAGDCGRQGLKFNWSRNGKQAGSVGVPPSVFGILPNTLPHLQRFSPQALCLQTMRDLRMSRGMGTAKSGWEKEGGKICGDFRVRGAVLILKHFGLCWLHGVISASGSAGSKNAGCRVCCGSNHERPGSCNEPPNYHKTP